MSETYKCTKVPMTKDEVATSMGLTKVGSKYCGPLGFYNRTTAMMCKEAKDITTSGTKYCTTNAPGGQFCFTGSEEKAKYACENPDKVFGNYQKSYAGKFIQNND